MKRRIFIHVLGVFRLCVGAFEVIEKILIFDKEVDFFFSLSSFKFSLFLLMLGVALHFVDDDIHLAVVVGGLVGFEFLGSAKLFELSVFGYIGEIMLCHILVGFAYGYIHGHLIE